MNKRVEWRAGFYQLAMLASMLLSALWTLPLWAAQPADSEILQRFELMRAAECRQIKTREPKEHIDVPSFSERHYWDVDGDGTCEIIDSWVDRLTPRLDDYRLDHFYANYRYENGRWKQRQDFQYVPKYQIRDKKTRRIYYLFDFDFNTHARLWINIHGASYFDRWPTRKDRHYLSNPGSGVGGSYGVNRCSYDGEYLCDGFDLGKIAEVLSKQQGPQASEAAPSTAPKPIE